MSKKKPEKVDLDALFPYEHHNVILEIPEENKVCWFADIYNAQKFIDRYNLNKKTIKLECRDEEPIEHSETNKNCVEPRPRKTSGPSSSGNRRSTKKLDGPTATNRTRKPKGK